MAVTIITEPATIAYTKNVIGYQVQTGYTDVSIYAELQVEAIGVPGTYEFVTTLKSAINASRQAFFYVHDILEVDVLSYTLPDLSLAIQDDNTVARKIRMRFFELPVTPTIIESFNYPSNNVQYALENELLQTKNYVMIISGLNPLNTTIDLIGAATQTVSPVTQIDTTTFVYAFQPAEDKQNFLYVSQDIDVIIYEYTQDAPVTSNETPAILGGKDNISFLN